MNVSQVIRGLQEFKDFYGDREVFILNKEFYCPVCDDSGFPEELIEVKRIYRSDLEQDGCIIGE